MNTQRQLPLTSDQLAKYYGVALPGEYQVIPYIFYDTALYTSATTTELFFFNQARAANVNFTTTNFYMNGIFPMKETFLITAIGIGYSEVVAATIGGIITVDATAACASIAGITSDMQNLMWNGVATFNFNHKDYGPLPLMAIPQGNGVTGMIDIASKTAVTSQTFNIASNGVPCVDDLFMTRYLVQGNETFWVRLAWIGAQTTMANVNIRVYLHGYWFRQVG